MAKRSSAEGKDIGTQVKKSAAEKKSGGSGKKKAASGKAASSDEPVEISSSKELKEFLLSIKDRMVDDGAAAVNIVSAMNYVLSIPNIEGLLDKDSKEIARDIWLRIKQGGLQLRNPPLLFDADEEVFPQPA